MRLTSLIPVLLADCLLSPGLAAQTPKAPLVIENVRVVDVHSGQLLADHSLVVSGSRVGHLPPHRGFSVEWPTPNVVFTGCIPFMITRARYAKTRRIGSQHRPRRGAPC